MALFARAFDNSGATCGGLLLGPIDRPTSDTLNALLHHRCLEAVEVVFHIGRGGSIRIR